MRASTLHVLMKTIYIYIYVLNSYVSKHQWKLLVKCCKGQTYFLRFGQQSDSWINSSSVTLGIPRSSSSWSSYKSVDSSQSASFTERVNSSYKSVDSSQSASFTERVNTSYKSVDSSKSASFTERVNTSYKRVWIPHNQHLLLKRLTAVIKECGFPTISIFHWKG